MLHFYDNSDEMKRTYKGFRHATPLQIRFKDTDVMGHVNNANHFTYMELARVHYFHDVIAHNNDWTQNGFILAKMTIDYIKPVMLGDDITVFTRCSRIGNKSFDLEYCIVKYTDSSEDLMATGTSVIVCYDYNINASIQVPDPWKVKMQNFEKSGQ